MIDISCKEARDLFPDPACGARITRLSGSSIRTENIYCDAPRATPDGKRFATHRYIDHLLSPTKALMCHDLATKLTGLIDRDTKGVPISPAWSGAVYYQRDNMLVRVSLQELQPKPVIELTNPLPPCWQLMSVSADERYLIYTTMTKDSGGAGGSGGSTERYNLVRLDLHDHSWKLLFETPQPSRCGAAFNPHSGHDLLISTTYWDGNVRHGVGLFADADGKNPREVMRNVHHSTWLGNTGKFAGLISFDYDKIAHLPENPDGELHIHSSDGTPPRLIPAPEHIFNHISASPCGRYVVCESLESGLKLGPVPIVVVNVETGKYRVLVGDANCSAGGDSARGVNPYFMKDMRHVIYNADPDGIVNVFAAEIPVGFLESLK